MWRIRHAKAKLSDTIPGTNSWSLSAQVSSLFLSLSRYVDLEVLRKLDLDFFSYLVRIIIPTSYGYYDSYILKRI